jgi:NAD/NADP transhydrogenase beta subunit
MEPASGHVIEIVYLAASVLFILSLKWMSSPGTARHGVWAGEIGMLLAICGTLLRRGSSTTSGSPSGWCWAPSSAPAWALSP